MNFIQTNEVIIAIFAVVIFAFYMSLDNSIRKRRKLQEIKSKLDLGDKLQNQQGSADSESISISDERSPLAMLFESILRLFVKDIEGEIKKLSEKFANAGINTMSAPIYYLFMKKVMIWPILSLAVFMLLVLANENILFLLIGIITAIIGMRGPDIWLENLITKRKQILMKAFPDTLDLVLICVESGLALDAALARVCKELGTAYPEMTEELERTRIELTMLSDRTQALLNLANRTDLVAFRSLVATLIQTEKFGTSLAETLRVLSEDFRSMRLLDIENKAGRLPAIMIVPLILLLLPSFLIIILGPSVIRVVAQGGIFGNK